MDTVTRSIVQAGPDASQYQRGAQQIEQGNAKASPNPMAFVLRVTYGPVRRSHGCRRDGTIPEP